MPCRVIYTCTFCMIRFTHFNFMPKMYMYGSVICHSSLKILWMNRDGVIIQMKLLW